MDAATTQTPQTTPQRRQLPLHSRRHQLTTSPKQKSPLSNPQSHSPPSLDDNKSSSRSSVGLTPVSLPRESLRMYQMPPMRDLVCPKNHGVYCPSASFKFPELSHLEQSERPAKRLKIVSSDKENYLESVVATWTPTKKTPRPLLERPTPSPTSTSPVTSPHQARFGSKKRRLSLLERLSPMQESSPDSTFNPKIIVNMSPRSLLERVSPPVFARTNPW